MNAPAPASGKIRCDACPVMCYIAPGQTGACDRYGNVAGRIVRSDPLTVLDRTLEAGGAVVPFAADDWDGGIVRPPEQLRHRHRRRHHLSRLQARALHRQPRGRGRRRGHRRDRGDLQLLRRQGEDRHRPPPRPRARGGPRRRRGGRPCHHRRVRQPDALARRCRAPDRRLQGRGPRHLRHPARALQPRSRWSSPSTAAPRSSVQAGAAPVVDGVRESRMRVGCGSATIGMFAAQWRGLVDEVVVVDDHITGVVSEHQAGRVLGWEPTGIRIRGHRSTPGRYFQVAAPGTGWGGTDLADPLAILAPFEARRGARPGLTLLMVSTTGEQSGYYVLDDALVPRAAPLPAALAPTVELIAENCEPALATVLFVAGAGGSLRAGVTANPVRLTRAVQHRQARVTCGGAPVYVWPGGGITFMVDVTRAARRTPSATSRPRPWSRRSSSPCSAPTTSRSAATPPRSARSTTSSPRGGEYTSGERRLAGRPMTGRRPPGSPTAAACTCTTARST